MDKARLKKVEETYHAILKIPESARESFFKEFCGNKAELRREVESLLSFQNISGEFLETPPESLAAEMFADLESYKSLIGKEIKL